MSIQFQCVHCDQTIKVRAEYAGRAANCPGCQQKIRIPAGEAPAEAPPARVARRPGPAVPEAPLAAAIPTKKSSQSAAPARRPGGESASRQQSPQKKPRPAASHPDDFGATSARELHQLIMAQFTGPIEPVRCTFLYRVALVFIALAVILLPLLYVGLIGLLGYGVYWHAVTNTSVAAMGTGRARGAAVMAYLAPILAGGIAVLFMLKPLFARMPQHFRQVSLNRSKQPLLFAFVEKICDTVHAPRPDRIDLVFDINASAGFSGGVLSLIRSNLVLTIGMPLVAGLSLQQFAGVLAHEFGHFSQGAAMRAQWIVMTVNMWFARIVYLRDEWDEWLEATSNELDIRIGWIFYFARFVVFLSRRVLWCFMMLSHALSCGMSRLMEYDADRYGARLAGAKAFESTSKRIFTLSYGANEFMKALYLGKISSTDDSLSGNFARDMVKHCESLDHIDQKRMKRFRKKEKTGWFDTHPCTADRVAAVKAEGAPGVFQCELPAEVVFNGFDKLCMSLQRQP